ncbi:MAG: hypothetical protein IJ728_02420 [Selenomonadaceae bacterium]|nr:hypothetical protein [Selenomonadaceae bacterium]
MANRPIYIVSLDEKILFVKMLILNGLAAFQCRRNASALRVYTSLI